MNKLFYTFFYETISYDCRKCNAACCKYGMLALTNSEYQGMRKKNKYIRYFSNTYGGKLKGISRHFKCWFLNKNNCSIETEIGYKHKPIYCRFFPFRLLKANDEYIVHLSTICPTLNVNSVIPNTDQNKIEANVRQLIKIGATREIAISKNRLALEKKIKEASIDYFDNTNYIDFIKFQLAQSTKLSTVEIEKELDLYILNWCRFLKVKKDILFNAKISRELSKATGLLRMSLYYLEQKRVPITLLALYMYMCLFDLSFGKKLKSSLYSYVSLLDLAVGMSMLNDKKLISKKIKEFAYNNKMIKVRKESFQTLTNKHLPTIEERIYFLRNLSVKYNTNDHLLI